MFTPPEMIMFETRSARYRYPSASRFPTSPRLLQPLSFQAAAVLAGSPWYSKRLGVSNHTSPCSPGASSSPSGPRMCTRSEEHTSELQSLMRISYAVFCLKKKKKEIHITHIL